MPLRRSLRALLARSIDYAGLFPPCSLDLATALKKEATYVRDADAWMLGAFVLPVAQFGNAKEHLAQFDSKNPLRVSVLGPKTSDLAAFDDAFQETFAAMGALTSRDVDPVTISQLEMALPADIDLPTLEKARQSLGNLPAFWETTPDQSESTIDLLARHNDKTNSHPFGYKLRTGGVTAEAFPTSQQIARALVAAERYLVPIKFTAGLHHPVRRFRDEVKTKMHGFLNVLGAAILAAENAWDEDQITAMLEDEEANSFVFDDKFFAWRQWQIAADRIEAARRFIVSFGSCSFDEPREDLRELGLL